MAVAASGALKEEVMGEAMQAVGVFLEIPKGAETLEALAEEVKAEVMGEAMEGVIGKLPVN